MYLPFMPPLAKLAVVGWIVLYFSTIAIAMWFESLEKKYKISLTIPILIVRAIGGVTALTGFGAALWMVADIDSFVKYFGG